MHWCERKIEYIEVIPHFAEDSQFVLIIIQNGCFYAHVLFVDVLCYAVLYWAK